MSLGAIFWNMGRFKGKIFLEEIFHRGISSRGFQGENSLVLLHADS